MFCKTKKINKQNENNEKVIKNGTKNEAKKRNKNDKKEI